MYADGNIRYDASHIDNQQGLWPSRHSLPMKWNPLVLVLALIPVPPSFADEIPFSLTKPNPASRELMSGCVFNTTIPTRDVFENYQEFEGVEFLLDYGEFRAIGIDGHTIALEPVDQDGDISYRGEDISVSLKHLQSIYDPDDEKCGTVANKVEVTITYRQMKRTLTAAMICF